MAGDAETGVCIMQMEAGLDTGPVLLREATPIGAEETTGDLHDRLSRDGGRADLSRRWSSWTDLVPEPQPEAGVTYAAKIDKAEARVDWTRPAVEVDRQIRGLSPFPGAWCEVAGERVKLLASRLARGPGPAGQVLDDRLTVACGHGRGAAFALATGGRGRAGCRRVSARHGDSAGRAVGIGDGACFSY